MLGTGWITTHLSLLFANAVCWGMLCVRSIRGEAPVLLHSSARSNITRRLELNHAQWTLEEMWGSLSSLKARENPITCSRLFLPPPHFLSLCQQRHGQGVEEFLCACFPLTCTQGKSYHKEDTKTQLNSKKQQHKIKIKKTPNNLIEQ